MTRLPRLNHLVPSNTLNIFCEPWRRPIGLVGPIRPIGERRAILSYSRSKGLFAGLELKGVKISIDDSDMRSVYGEGASASEVLRGTRPIPAEVQAFPTALSSYSMKK